MKLTVPVELVSESNVREHWAKKGNRKKKQRRAVRQAWLLAGEPVLPSLMMLKLTRVCTSRRKIRDFDNLVGCFKAVIDEVADIAGIDDKDVFWPEKRKEGFQQVVGESMECVIEIIDMTRIGEELTELQAEFLGCWIERSEELGYSPSLRQMQELASWNAQQLMDYVVEKGYVRRDAGVSRGTSLTEQGRLWLLKRNK